jgi:hypothetical protein
MSSRSVLVITALLVACSGRSPVSPDGSLDLPPSSGPDVLPTCDPTADDDGDGISNGEEGCLTRRDTDHDKIPDYLDVDSDDDGVPDKVEAGAKDAQGKCLGATAPKDRWPCDSDGDGMPDVVDIDSDNDGLLDGEEDFDGDGLLGCCFDDCHPVGAQALKCPTTPDGCGEGQVCTAGKCTPRIAFLCSGGETDPRQKSTFPDGKLDAQRGSFVCRDVTTANPHGRKTVQTRTSLAGDWQVALEKTAKYTDVSISDAAATEAAAVIDEDGASAQVAAFVLSLPVAAGAIQQDLASLLASISAKLPGAVVRASGTQLKSHDRFDTVEGTTLDLTLPALRDVSTVRNDVLAALLGRPAAQLGNLPGAYGDLHNNVVVRLVTVRRFEFLKDSTGQLVLDAKGYPVDSGDPSKRRLVVMGAVALLLNYKDPARATRSIADDLSGGTALAVPTATLARVCDVNATAGPAAADIIWVVDDSGSMDDNQSIADNAASFFSRALAAGLDFRMGVTGVNDPNGASPSTVGHLCADHFLLPSEQAVFASCITNPPGYAVGSEYGLTNALEAVKKHLPRAVNSPDRIRSGARLVIILASDEAPAELKGSLFPSDPSQCVLTSIQRTQLDAAIKPYLDLFTGVSDPEGAAVFHALAGVCGNTCSAEVAHGYQDLAWHLGGQVGDICQADLSATLQVIIDSLVGGCSPLVLDHRPVAASLAVALDGVPLQRSHTAGFDYRAASNSIALINVKHAKGSELVASYLRWVTP